MSAQFDPDDLRTLFAAFHDGTISATDHVRLDRLLTESAEARRRWFLHCDLETGLAEWAEARSEPASKVMAVPRATFLRRALRLAPLAAAAVAMLLFFWWRPHRFVPVAETPASGVAVLARAVGAEWSGEAPRTGAVLAPGLLRLKSGAVLLEFYSGARVVLEGPAELKLIGSGEAFLSSGKVNAHVPPQARGFTLNSTGVKVVDLGTDFALEVQAGSAPEVHVFTGVVEVASASRPVLALREGEAARFAPGTPTRLAARREAFLTEEQLAAMDSAQAERRLAAWRASSEVAGAVIHYTFDEAGAGEQRVTNHGVPPSPETHGSIVGGAWTEGRWPGKRALELRGAGDRVRFIAPQPMHAVTLLAWVRVNALPRAHHFLLAADSEQPGALHWNLTQAGELRLEIARDLGRPQADWEAVNSAPFVTPERYGEWLLLATTFDGQTIRHYGNGELIGRGASFTPPMIHVGAAELGNWRGATQRHLAATLDEFLLLPRVMTGEELREFFKHGKP